MSRELIHTNPLSGLRAFAHLEGGDIKAVTEELPHATADSCATYTAHMAETRRPLVGNTQDHMRHAATIPSIFINKLMREGRGPGQDPDAFKEWLRTECPRAFLGKM